MTRAYARVRVHGVAQPRERVVLAARDVVPQRHVEMVLVTRPEPESERVAANSARSGASTARERREASVTRAKDAPRRARRATRRSTMNVESAKMTTRSSVPGDVGARERETGETEDAQERARRRRRRETARAARAVAHGARRRLTVRKTRLRSRHLATRDAIWTRRGTSTCREARTRWITDGAPGRPRSRARRARSKT